MKPYRYLSAIFLISAITAVLGSTLIAQSATQGAAQGANEHASDIVLPDITTHIEGVNAEVDPAAIPVIQAEDPALEANSLPALTEVTIPPEAYTPEDEQNAALKEKNAVYIEGIAGGGYPGVFTGVFSLYQPQGEIPWRLGFSHESAQGYQNGTASQGYFDTDTILSGDAEFPLSDSVTLNLAGAYDTVTAGMQGQSQQYYNSTAQNIGLDSQIRWELPADFTLSGNLKGSFLNQYIGSVSSLPPNTYTGAGLFTLEPAIAALWSGGVFSARFDGGYRLDAITESGAEPWFNVYSHRGAFSLEGSLALSGFTLGASAGVIIRDDGTLLPPFAVSAAIDLPAKTAITLSGGLRAQSASIQNLLRREPFITAFLPSHSSLLPSLSPPPEESDWFGSLSLSWKGIPGLTLTGDADFLKTAFGHGTLVSSYEAYGTPADSVSGLFDAFLWDRTMLNTTLLAEYSYKLLTAAVGWRSQWLDHNWMTASQQIIGRIALSPESARWGASLEAAVGIASAAIPEISLSGFAGVTEKVSIHAEFLDIGTLFTPNGRIRAAPYINRGFQGIVKLQFLF
jgi:hypothetical protein